LGHRMSCIFFVPASAQHLATELLENAIVGMSLGYRFQAPQMRFGIEHQKKKKWNLDSPRLVHVYNDAARAIRVDDFDVKDFMCAKHKLDYTFSGFEDEHADAGVLFSQASSKNTARSTSYSS
jgi:hypothetical protein